MASESIAHSASGLIRARGIIIKYSPYTGNYQIQSNPVNTDNEGTIESVCINGVSVLEGLEKEKCKEFLSAGTKQTVRNKEVSVAGVHEAGATVPTYGQLRAYAH